MIWIDAGNSFDPYGVSVSARRRGTDPRAILKAIQVARPFTAFQLHQIISKVPQSFPPPLVIISDFMGLFYDENLPDRDLNRAFRDFQSRLGELGRRAVVIGLAVNRPVPVSRNHLLPQVLGLARRVFMPACTAREDLTAPVKQAAALACSLLAIWGAACMKRFFQFLIANVLYGALARGVMGRG